MNRRRFLKCAALAGAGLALCPSRMAWAEDAAPNPKVGRGGADERFVRPAMFWEKLDGGKVRCRLCPRECVVEEGRRGRCGVRENRGGEYFTLVYGRVVALNNDPVEKKPFNHFHPGSMVLSLATAGCNITCKFCQNWQISQFKPEEVEARLMLPADVVGTAKDLGSPNVALTYSEPTVFYEYMHDVAKAASEAGLRCIVVSNGFINPEPVRKLAPFLAAYKVDLKGFDPDYYRDMCGARLEPVLETLKTLAGLGLWTEIVNLVLPTANDDLETVKAMAGWIKANLGDLTPIHFTRFHPMYKIRNLPPTPVATLEAIHKTAREAGLKYAYIGNVPGHPAGNTYCHNCGFTVIERVGLWDVISKIEQGRCPKCQTALPGVWG